MLCKKAWRLLFASAKVLLFPDISKNIVVLDEKYPNIAIWRLQCKVNKISYGMDIKKNVATTIKYNHCNISYLMMYGFCLSCR